MPPTLDHAHAPPSAPSRLLRLGLALAMALALVGGAQPSAEAHAGCFREATTNSVFQSVVSAFNVFASVFSSSAMSNCVDQFAEVEPVMERDYVADDVATSSSASGKATTRGNKPLSQAKCKDGMAADTFPCHDIDMLGHVTMEELGSVFVNDMWGWTDPETKQDFALVGGSEGTFFVDISDPRRPVVQGLMPTASTRGGSFWRDIKVYDDHAFVVSEHTDHGVQVFDLTQLRDWDGERTTYQADARYTGHGSAHNIHVNTETGFAYSVGAAPFEGGTTSAECGNGIHMIDIRDPLAPTFAGCFQEHSYVHDTQCVIYEGPDAEHRGREICVNSNGINYNTDPDSNFLSIVDVTDKSNPIGIAQVPYDGSGYSHQGWLTEDQAYFFHGDEGDEILTGVNTTTRIWDLRDLDNPVVTDTFVNDTTSIDHNMYTEGNVMYQSNYTTGLRIQDVSDPADGIRELAYFDVYPDNDNASFEGGTWSNYPYFSQKKIVAVSSIDRGLFILRPKLRGAR